MNNILHSLSHLSGQLALVCYLCCLCTSGFSQVPGVSYDISFFGGRIIKHTSNLKFDVPTISGGVELALRWQKYGKKEWHERQGYPTSGIALSYFDFGDGEKLGRAYSASAMLELYFVQRATWDFYFQPAVGVGFLDRSYDINTNPEGNAVGSLINSAVSFRFGAHFDLSKAFRMHAGATFSHWSNGGSALPNFGINLPALQVGLEYTPARVLPQDFLHFDLSRTPLHRWGMNAWAGFTKKEMLVPDGPSFPLYITSVAVTYELSNANTLSAGTEYELDMSVYRFGQHIYLYETEEAAWLGASRFMVFLGDEFHFGHSSILVQAGTYLGDDAFLVPWKYYTKLAYRYYFKEKDQPGVRPYIGIYMKSHRITAEYFALGGGVSIR